MAVHRYLFFRDSIDCCNILYILCSHNNHTVTSSALEISLSLSLSLCYLDIHPPWIHPWATSDVVYEG